MAAASPEFFSSSLVKTEQRIREDLSQLRRDVTEVLKICTRLSSRETFVDEVAEDVSDLAHSAYDLHSPRDLRRVDDTSRRRPSWQDDWPASLPLRQALEIEMSNLTATKDESRLIAEIWSSPVGASVIDGMESEPLFQVLMPNSQVRFVFDLMSLFVLMFELIYTPFSLTWPVQDYTTVIVILLGTTGFWLLDLILNFVTGFQKSDGDVEMRFHKIAERYLKTYFMADLACVLGDGVTLILNLVDDENGGSHSRSYSTVLRTMKLARFLRVAGIMRLFRVMAAFTSFMELHLSEAWRLMINIFQITALLLWLGHLVACSWVAMGLYAPGGLHGDHWIDTRVGLKEQFEIDELNRIDQYIVAYHWGLAQITLGAHDVNPLNSWERLFTILCNLFGLLFGGTLVSILSATLIDLREMNQERNKTMRVLKAFLCKHNVEVEVRMRVMQQVSNRWSHRETFLVEKDVYALQLLSVGVRKELRFAVMSPYLWMNPLLRAWHTLEVECIKQLCSDQTGANVIVLLPDDELFSEGDVAEAAYILMDGKVTYTHGMSMIRHITMAERLSEGDVCPGSCVSEAAWFVHWVHMGIAKTASPCRLIAITPENILGVMVEHVSVRDLTVAYGRALHQCIVKGFVDAPPTDLQVPYVAFEDLFMGMSQQVQAEVGSQALRCHTRSRRLRSRSYAWAKEFRLLERNVLQGEVVVSLDVDCNLQCHVVWSQLQLQRSDGTVLVEVAACDGNRVGSALDAVCRLPDTKKDRDADLPHNAVDEILKARMPCLIGILEGPPEVRVEREIDADTARVGVQRHTIRRTFSVSCNDQCEEELSRHMVTLDRSSSWLLSDMAVANPPRGRSSAVLSSLRTKSQSQLVQQGVLEQKLAGIRQVYVLIGPSHVGVYSWMPMTTVNALCQDRITLQRWVESFLKGVLIQPPGMAGHNASLLRV